MRKLNLLSTSILAAIVCGGATAQVDIIYSNISVSRGHYKDSIILWNATTQFPLVSEAAPNPRGASDSARKFRLRNVGGTDYLYWLNITPSDAVFRGSEQNGNGVIDSTEIEEVFAFDAVSQGQLDEMNGQWWVSCGNSGAVDRGLWLMQDMNGDGDWKDTGESTQVISGSTNTIGSATISTDDIRAVGFLPNGDCIWYEDDARVWVRTTQAGVSDYFLVYRAPVITAGTAPAQNPDFGTTLPAFNNRFDRLAIDRATGTIYIGVNFSTVSPYIFACNDVNADGDVNDAGEVTMFFNGLLGSPVWGAVDDIDWFNGSLYLSYEIDQTNDPGSQFIQLTDLNSNGNAMDPGELVQLGRTAITDDPTAQGLIAVPAGTFGPTCVNAAIQNDADMSTAGGTVNFSFKDIPASLQGGGVFGFCGITAAGDGPTTLPGGCIIGYTPDMFTTPSLGLFNGAVTGATLALPAFNYPAGLSAGWVINFAGILVDFPNSVFVGITGTGNLTVQ